jgi:hypothetical protein
MHLVIWDGCSAYVDSHTSNADEEVVGKFTDLEAASDYAETYNEEHQD